MKACKLEYEADPLPSAFLFQDDETSAAVAQEEAVSSPSAMILHSSANDRADQKNGAENDPSERAAGIKSDRKTCEKEEGSPRKKVKSDATTTKKSFLEDSSSDSDDDSVFANWTSPSSAAKKTAKKNDMSSSSEDELEWTSPRLARRRSVSSSRGRRRQRQEKPKNGKPIQSDTQPMPLLTLAEKREKLTELESACDRNLQRLLWSLGCRYSLLPYQCLGVRAIAGVPADFPQPLVEHQMSISNSMDDDDDDDDDDEASLDTKSPKYWKKILNKTQFRADHGILMADVMGLGKTVQAVVGCILRNLIFDAKGGGDRKPTLLVSPNDAVLAQWQDTLLVAGVPADRIFNFIPKNWNQRFTGAIYSLCTRYQLQTEVKQLFAHVDGNKVGSSPMFPKASRQLLQKLKLQYETDKGKCRASNVYRQERESASECVTRLLRNCRTEETWRTVVIDECHFLKNLVSYWGIGAALLGLHSERIIPMTGTPYNNGSQDIATIMTFINPKLASANDSWWKEATKTAAAEAVAEAVSEWHANYVVRREKSVLGDRLPKKSIQSVAVSPLPLELQVYEHFEARFLHAMDQFSRLSDDRTPEAMVKKKRLFEMMLSMASCMRVSLIHPVLPSSGRDWTIHFSPSRRALARNRSNPLRCACCKKRVKRKKNAPPRNARERRNAMENLNDDRMMLSDDEASMDGEDGDDNKPKKYGTGPMTQIPQELCLMPKEAELYHYACESCLEDLQHAGSSCPLCEDLRLRAHLGSAEKFLEEKKMKAEKEGKEIKAGKKAIAKLEIDRGVYCKDILGGFKASAKIESILQEIQNIPADDKLIVLSFFKGSLDLLEAILHYELKIGFARFDGDVMPGEREAELKRFKTEQSCRVLLMTVQTGGVGLNIVEANRVAFVDRWFNPFVHAQAQDRCHRLKQEKDVFVTYHDVSATIDVVMQHLNDVKSSNADIVLADGSTMGAGTRGLTYKEMSGLLGNGIRAVLDLRIQHVSNQENWNKPMGPTQSGALQSPRGAVPRFASIVEAMASALGFIPSPTTPSEGGQQTTPPAAQILLTGQSGESDDSSFEELLHTPVFSPSKETKPARAVRQPSPQYHRSISTTAPSPQGATSPAARLLLAAQSVDSDDSSLEDLLNTSVFPPSKKTKQYHRSDSTALPGPLPMLRTIQLPKETQDDDDDSLPPPVFLSRK